MYRLICEPLNRERLTILSEEVIKGKRFYNCQCTCGKVIKISKGNLKRTHSCGCYRKEWAKRKLTTHGLRRSRFYKIWCEMKYRCTNPRSNSYLDYGGRGISVCDRWKRFEYFLEDMFYSYIEHCVKFGAKNTTIDRKDVNSGYSLYNCKWSTMKEQLNNTRRNHYIEHNGKSQSLKMWSEELDLNYYTLKTRLSRGWSFEEAIKCHSR